MYCYYTCSVALSHGVVGCIQYVIVVFPEHTHLLFFSFTVLVNTYNYGVLNLSLVLKYTEQRRLLNN